MKENKNRLKLIVKRILLACFVVMSIFSVFNFAKVLASVDDIVIQDVTIVDKSSTTDASIVSFGRDSLETRVTYHNVNDYVEFKINIKNNDSKKYTVKTITDDNTNANMVYDYDKHENEVLNSGDELDLNIKATYKTAVNNKNGRNVNSRVNFKIVLVDENGEEDEKVIPINPKTNDKLIIYGIMAFLSLIGLVLLLKKIKIQKALLILLIMTPFIVKAATINYIFDIKNEIKFYDKMLVTIDVNGNKEERLVPYNTTITAPDAVNIPGYEFDNWYNGENVMDFTNPITEDIEIKAKYNLLTYNITYDLNGGVETTNPGTYTVEDSIALAEPTKDFYDFAGWTGTDLTEPTKVVTISNKTGARSYTATYTPKSYTITYDGLTPAEKAAAGNPETYTIESSNITLHAPSRNGYSFAGWTGSNGDIPGPVTINTGSHDNKTYTANFSLETYGISYDYAGGTVATENPSTYTIESSAITLVEPTKNGYTFTGWTGTGLSEPTKNLTIPVGSYGARSYTANYSLNTYTINYDGLTDAEKVATGNPTSYTVETASFTLHAPADRLDGDGDVEYTFTGWKVGDTVVSAVTLPDIYNLEDKTYEATWTYVTPTTYNINYELSGGTVATANPTEFSKLIPSFTLNNPTKTGYTFKGWSGTGLTGDENTTVVVNTKTKSDLSYEAHYTANKYYVVFDKNANDAIGSMSNQELTYDTSDNLDNNIYTRTGYNFVGWNTAPGGTGTHYDDGDSVINLATSGNVTLYAEWELKVITVTYDSQGGSLVSATPLTYGQTLGDVLSALPTPTKTNSLFAGWYIDLSDPTSLIDLTYAPSDDIEVHAKWSSFICIKATSLATETCESGVNTSQGCKAAGYTPTGSQGTNIITYGKLSDSDTMAPGDAYLCDVDGTGYNERFYYLRTKDNNAVLILDHSVAEGVKQAQAPGLLPDATSWSNLPVTFENSKAGRFVTPEDLDAAVSGGDSSVTGSLDEINFVFEGTSYSSTDSSRRSTVWVLKNGVLDSRYHKNTRNVVAITGTISSSENSVRPVIEVPVSLMDNAYIINYDSQGGTIDYTVQRVERGSSIGSFPTTTYGTYDFGGWYADTAWTTRIDETYVPNDYDTYYARWTVFVNRAAIDETSFLIENNDTENIVITNINELEPISYASNDDSIATVDSNGVITATGIGETEIIITGELSGQTRIINVEVVAEVTTFHVIFNSQGGSDVAPMDVPKNTAIGSLPADPTLSGSAFDGWYTNTSYTTMVTTSTIIDGNKTFYARWVPDDAVAEINGSFYTTIQAAVDAAPTTKTTIRILQDVTVNAAIDLKTKNTNKDIVVDLNGHTITGTASGTTKFSVFENSAKLEITNGTVTSDRSSGTLNNNSTGTLVVNGATIRNTGDKQAIYNEGGTVTIKGNTVVTSQATGAYNNVTRGTVQNNSGTMTIISGEITNTGGAALTLGAGTLAVGTKDNVYDTTNLVIQGNTYGIKANTTYNLYDGMIKGKTAAVDNESRINDIEDNSTKMNDSQGGYYRLYYEIAALAAYHITLDANGGSVNPDSVDVIVGDQVGSLPTPTYGTYTFEGWYTSNNEEVLSTRTPAGDETYHAVWSSSGQIVTFRTTNNAMKVYYQNIVTWKNSSSNFPTWSANNNSPNWALDPTENTVMLNNFNNNNCMCADGQCSSTGTVECDKPEGYDTGHNELVNVYLSDSSRVIGEKVNYTKSENGVIYNLIPDQVYFWNLASDPEIHGYIMATGERRNLNTGDVRNSRDLGGLPVDTDGDGTVDGHLAYGRLFRGIKLNSQNSVTDLENLGVNSELDLREANSDAYKISRYQRIEAQNYFVDPNGATQVERNYYTMTRNAVTYAMQEVVAGNNLYFHCRIGTDRTGTVAYVLEGLLGVPEEDRIEDYELSFFYGLVRIHRYHDEKPGSSVGTGKERFVYMHNLMASNSDIYNWYMAGSSDTSTNHPDQDLIDAFRAAMIESN